MGKEGCDVGDEVWPGKERSVPVPTQQTRIDAARMMLEFNRRIKLQEYPEALLVAEKILELEPDHAVVARFRDVLHDKVHLNESRTSIPSPTSTSACTSSGEDEDSSSQDDSSSVSSESDESSDEESISDPDSGAVTSEDEGRTEGPDWEWVPGLGPDDFYAAQLEGENRRREAMSRAGGQERALN